jgi:hypothetical protein
MTKYPIEVLFMKRSMEQRSIPTGSNYSWKLGNFNSSVRFVFVAFKTKAAASQQTNNALFREHDGANEITSLRIQLNNMYYPIDGMKIKLSAYDITESYLAYITVCKIFGVEPQLSAQEHHDLYSTFCVDLSAQPE